MLINNEIVHVYFMPGMAANPSIFEHIKLPEDKFQVHWLEWLLPEPKESLKDYALRMNSFIEHENIVLVGVSFGGIVVQEMSKYLTLKRLIIISSVKQRGELPRRMRYASNKGLVKFIPTSLLNHI
ncbi:MAG TPA: alpha/beta hydrolase [Gillisia sp.]|nr:alpha/beta hydrolase [Gillisia sp.]